MSSPAVSHDIGRGVDAHLRLPALTSAARVAFGVAIVLSPFRARFTLRRRPEPPLYGDFTDFLLFWSDIAVVVTLVLWAASRVADPRPMSLGPRFLRWPVAALVALAWIGVATSIDAPYTVYASIRLTGLALVALYVANEVRGPAAILPALCAMVGVQAIVAIGQVLAQESIGWKRLGEHELDPATGVSVVTSVDGDRLLRAYGLADHPNILGGLLGFALLGILASLPTSGESRRGVAVGVFAAGSLAMALTFSRGAAVAFGVAYVAAVAVMAGRRLWGALRWWLIAGAVGLLLAVALVEPYGEFIRARTDATSGTDIATERRSLDEREALVEVTNDVIVDRPLLGAGAGTVARAVRDEAPGFEFDYQPAHFVLLDAAAEIGLAGALAYSVVILAPWPALWVARSRAGPELIGASAVFAAVTIAGFFDYYTWTYAAGQFWHWLALGLWVGTYEAARRD